MGCDWYSFQTVTGYGIPVTWQDIAQAYEAATGNKEEVKLSVLTEWLLAKTTEVEGLKIYDVGHHFAFFTLRGLCITGGKGVYIPGPYEIEVDETDLVYLNQIHNLPGYGEDDQLLEGIAKLVTPSEEPLSYPSGSWVTTIGNQYDIRVLKRKGQSSSEPTTKKAKTESGDKCRFIVGTEKKEIEWDRNVLAESNPTLKNILFGTGQIKPDPSKPVEWPEFHPDAATLIFSSLPLKEVFDRQYAKVVPDDVYNSCKLLADYLGIDFHRLWITSDRFKRRKLERYGDQDDSENETEDDEDEDVDQNEDEDVDEDQDGGDEDEDED